MGIGVQQPFLQSPRHATGTLVGGGGGCRRVVSSAASRVAAGLGSHSSGHSDTMRSLGLALAYLKSKQV